MTERIEPDHVFRHEDWDEDVMVTVGEHLGWPLKVAHYPESAERLAEHKPQGWYFVHLCLMREEDDPDGQYSVYVPVSLMQHQCAENAGLVTVQPSILCGGCNLHGWVTDNVWTSA